MKRLWETRWGPDPPFARVIFFAMEVLAIELLNTSDFQIVENITEREIQKSTSLNSRMVLRCTNTPTHQVSGLSQYHGRGDTTMVQIYWARENSNVQYFRRIFFHRFASSKKKPLATLSPFRMRQQEQESMRAYIHRFNARVFPNLLISTFIQGLRLRDLFNSLVKKPSVSRTWWLRRKNILMWRKRRQIGWKNPNEPSEYKEKLGQTILRLFMLEAILLHSIENEKYWALKICEKIHLIQWPKESDKGPRGLPSNMYCDFQ